MIFVLKLIIAILLWVIAHRICEKYPYDWMIKKDDLKPYDYYSFYSFVYMMVFLIIILIV